MDGGTAGAASSHVPGCVKGVAMSQHSFSKSARTSTYLVVAGILSFFIAFLVLAPGRRSGLNSRRGTPGQPASGGDANEAPSARQLTGAVALEYMRETSEGQSLMQAVTEARFGLQWRDEGLFGEKGGGYLGMSHV